jgi:hypothetical protein
MRARLVRGVATNIPLVRACEQVMSADTMSDLAHVADEPVVHRSLMCSEVWGANSSVAHSVELPGLQGWVYSAPIDIGGGGRYPLPVRL